MWHSAFGALSGPLPPVNNNSLSSSLCCSTKAQTYPQVYAHVTRRPRPRARAPRPQTSKTNTKNHSQSPPPPSHQYTIREADASELYAVADVRCGAFYAAASDQYFYPLRRREMYDALRERVRAGTMCLVARDHEPTAEWRPFAAADGALVVASLDLTCHLPDGTRHELCAAGAPPRGARFYVSSMAVRAEWRRQGLASGLLREVERAARERGVRAVFLHVDESNEAAVKLYAAFGYRRTHAAPKWMAALAKREHTLLSKPIDPPAPAPAPSRRNIDAADVVSRRIKQLAVGVRA